MSELKAFIGHSFAEDDKDVVHQFIDFFDHVKEMGIEFSWEHAEPAEPKILSEKVLKLMEGKNLFIGICTAKELAITLDKLKKTRWDKHMLKAKDDEFARKTSDWIIQEIGVAIGKNMDVIILLEEGLRKPGGLQGDLEYIGFNRDEPSKSFNKILEMLKALTPKKKIDHIAQMEVAEKKECEIVEEKRDESLELSDTWKKENYEYALCHSIARSDEEQEQKIIKAYLESEEGQKDPDREAFEALRFYFRQLQGKGVYVKELKSLSNEHPENSMIAFYLGKAYEKYNDYDKAADQYEKSAKYAKNDEERLIRLCNAAVIRCKSGVSDAEDWLLNQARDSFASANNGEFRILSALKNIAELQDAKDKYLAYSERILDISPDEHDLRFSLAYKYSNLENNELSLFHYLLIPDADRSSTTWNNVGVAHSSLGIEGKAVDAYRKSEAMGGTLAMSNLAHKFVGAGFLKEAEEVCDRAVKIENYDKQVGTAITNIKKTKEEEKDKQKKVLQDIEKRRKFYIDFGKSCLKHLLKEHKGIWIGPECDLTIAIKEKNFIATGNYEKKETSRVGLLGALYMGYPIGQKEKIVKVNIRYEGIITGYGIEFKLYIEEEGKKPYLPTAFLAFSGPSKEGLMIIADDTQKIRVYEKGTKETEKFYELRRK